MEVLMYLLTSVVTALGLLFGVFTGMIAKEELREGMKYLEVFADLLLAAIFVSLIFIFGFHPIVIVLAIAWFITFFYINQIKKVHFVYFVLGIIFALAFNYKVPMLIPALIFLYGFPIGSLEYYKRYNKKKYWKFIALAIFIFIVTANVLFWLR